MPHKPPATAGLEAFSDGVIAVIITIMVLELKVPHEEGLPALRAILPTLLVYALSFAFTEIYWINHHHLIARTEHCDNTILYTNLAFLFCLSLIPASPSPSSPPSPSSGSSPRDRRAGLYTWIANAM